MMTADVPNLDERRSLQRQRVRDDSAHILLVLPHTDGDLAHTLYQLEEFLALTDGDDDGTFEGREAADAIGRLAGFVATLDCDEPPTQPVAPDGRYELVPLLFAPLARLDLGRILTGLDELPAAPRSVHAMVADHMDAGALVAAGGRLAALLRLPWDDDVDLLHARLGRPVVATQTERIVLSAEEYAAYNRLSERILGTYYGGDPLERFVYRHAAPPGS